MKLSPLGLRWIRVRQWLAVIKDNEQRPTFKQWREMLWLSLRSLWRPIDRQTAWRWYYRCGHCPLHDKVLHRCGSPDSGLGCHCFMPYAIATGKQCWARQQEPPLEIGYP